MQIITKLKEWQQCSDKIFSWSMLKEIDVDLYKTRKEIVRRRIIQKIQEIGGCITIIHGDGNCLIYTFLHHFGENMFLMAVVARKQLIQYMNIHKRKYSILMQNSETINEYSANYKFLDEVHLNALHNMHGINIIVFEYHIGNDRLSTKYYLEFLSY